MNEIPPPELPSESADTPFSSLIPDHELIRRIGHGSYGEVWLARNIMGTYRAVKVVHRGSFEDERPFEREYSGIRSFEPISRSHESQVDILHVGRQEELFYYVMELADDQMTGQEIDPGSYVPNTLNTLVQRREKLSAEETLEIALALTTALEHLHSHGLIHRDIKPSNIIFVHGIPKLADIGLVSKIDDCRSFVGTEGFLPPEGPGTARADIYSLGKVLYEACTGRDRKDYPELPTMLAELPDRERLLELNAIIAKACREDASERYASADEMHQDFLLMQSGKSVLRMQALERRLAQLRSVGLVGLVVILIALGAYFFQRHQTAEATRLAEENTNLAEENVEQLRRLKVAKGVELMDKGDLGSSLLWFADALQLVKNDPVAEAKHRFRFEQVWGRLPRLIRMFPHEASVNSIRFSPNGKRLVTASGDKTARVWDVETGEPITPPLVHEESVTMAVFDRRGKFVLSWGRESIARLWDPDTGESIGSPFRHAKEIVSALFHPTKDSVITFSLDGDVYLWDIASGEPLQRFTHGSAISAVAVSSDGRLIAAGGETGRVQVWEATTGELVSTSDHSVSISSLHFVGATNQLFVSTSYPGERYVGLGEGRVINSFTGQIITRMVGHTNNIGTSSISPDEKLVITGSRDTTGRVWNLKTGQSIGSPLAHLSNLRHVEFSPDGRLVVTTSSDRSARVWNALTGEPVTPFLQHGAWVTHATFSPDGTLLATASDSGQAKLWSLSAMNDQPRQLHGQSYKYAKFGNLVTQAELALLTGDNVVEEWSLDGTERLNSVEVSNHVLRPFIYKDHIFLYAYENEQFSWSILNRNSDDSFKRELSYQKEGYKMMNYLPESARVMMFHGVDGKVFDFLDPFSGRVLIENISLPARTYCLDATGEKVAVGLVDGSMHMLDTATGRNLFSVRHDSAVLWIAFSPDDRWILTTSSDQTGRIWDAATGYPRTPPFRHGGNVEGGVWSPDGLVVVTFGLNRLLQAWNAESGLLAFPRMPHNGPVESAIFSPNGWFLGSISRDNTARIWDATTGEPLTPALKLNSNPRQIAFSPGGTRFYVGLTGGVHYWELDKFKISVSANDMPDLAELFTAQSADAAGNLSLLAPTDLWEKYISLRRDYASIFESSKDDNLRWHHQQLNDSLAEGNDYAATFHRLQLKAKGGELDWHALIASIEALKIPKLAIDASSSALDLTDFYNLPLANGWRRIVGYHGFADLSPGIVRIGNLDFDIRGIVHLRGSLSSEPEMHVFPIRVDRIPVGRIADRLHFLHSLLHAHVPDGWRIGHYLIRYVGGLEIEFPLHKGIEVDDWLAVPKEVEDSPLRVGWRGHTKFDDNQDASVMLFLSTWDNPLPDQEIESIDFVSANEEAWPFLLAITTETDNKAASDDETE